MLVLILSMKRFSIHLILCYLFWVIILTKPVYFIFDISAYMITAGITVTLLVIAFLLFNLQFLRPDNVRYYWKQMDRYLVLYTLWIFITILLPLSESKTIEALGNALLFLATILIASITMGYNTGDFSRIESRNLTVLSLLRFSSLIVVTVGMVLYGFKMIDRSEIIGGLSPSVIGFYASVCIIISLSFIKQSRRGVIKIIFDYLAIILCLTYLVFSVAKGSFVALILSVLVSSIIFWKQLRIWHLPVFAGFAVIISYFLSDLLADYFANYIFPRNPYEDNIRTLTGRTDLWLFVLDYYLNNSYRIMFGYGYHSFSELFSDSASFLTGAGQAHNAIIEIIFETGVIGLAFIMFSIGKAVKKIVGIWFNKQNSFEVNLLIFTLMTLILFLLIRGFTEAGYGSASSTDHYLMGLVIVMTNLLPANRLREPI